MINNFEKWFASTNENLLKEEVSEAPKVSTDSAPAVGRKGMMHDVDTIMTSLDALSVELTEELEAVESGLAMNEAGAGDAIKQWFISMKAAKAQQKVNKIKMNAADLEFAADQADGDKAKAIKAKLPKVKLQATELQKMVDDKYGSKGAIVSSRISKEKIKGQLEIIKRTTGMEDDPKKKAGLKTKMKELAMKSKEEDQAIADFEDKNAEDIQKEKERIEAEAQASRDKEDGKEETPKEETPKEETPKEETPEEETPEEETPEEKTAREEKEDAAKKKEKEAEKVAKEEEAKKKEEERVAALSDEEKEAEKVAKEAEAKKKEEEAKKKEEERVAALSDEEKEAEKVAKEAEAKKKEEEAKKAKEVNDSLQIDNDLITRARNLNLNELAADIESKLDWQVSEGTVLRSNYEAIIKKAESDQILNESKYQVNSVKDAFRRLM